jgi:peptide deformylase
MAKILDIVTNPNKILRLVSDEIDMEEVKSKEFRTLLADMIETMFKKDGVGLAAPQIGKNIRLFVINTKDGTKAIINPKITKKSLLKEVGEEGCLSVPGHYGKVKRHKKVICTYFDEDGNKKTIEAQGFMARVIQHENDHLDGVLFIDKEIK